MLDTLNIKNFAIIQNTTLTFSKGFNVLIGNSGAGKSIVLDAISFVLGGKASKEIIRNGEDETSVKATFCNVGDDVYFKLKDLGIEAEQDVLVVSRNFNIDGKSVCRINGEIVTVSMLKQIGELLFDMFGQNESVEVLNIKNHLAMLDSFKSDELVDAKSQIKSLLDEYKMLQSKIDEIGGQDENRDRLLDLIKYQIDEIEKANLQIGEDEELETKLHIMTNFEKISLNLKQTYDCLQTSNFGSALSALEVAQRYDENLKDLNSRLDACVIELDDITSCVSDYLSNMNFSENEIDELNSRLDLIKQLKKKYGESIEQVLGYCDAQKAKYDEILCSEEILNKLVAKKNDVAQKLYNVCLTLHDIRVNHGNQIKQQIQDELCDLGMKNTTVSILFKPIKPLGECTFSLNGLDQVEFMFSANAGEKQKSLAKVISGGEMSRFMLAVKSVLNNQQNNLCVFDEIDSGVSGEIGYKVGQKLYKLSKDYQVLCITHLPQVIALADKHILITKQVENNMTKSVASDIDKNDLVEYLSSLFGSYTSDAGLKHAEELLSQANNFKLSLNK